MAQQRSASAIKISGVIGFTRINRFMIIVSFRPLHDF
jgi:hypothetical protein